MTEGGKLMMKKIINQRFTKSILVKHILLKISYRISIDFNPS